MAKLAASAQSYFRIVSLRPCKFWFVAFFDEKGDVFRSIEIVVVLSKHVNPELSVLNQERFTLEIDRYRPSEFFKAAEIL